MAFLAGAAEALSYTYWLLRGSRIFERVDLRSEDMMQQSLKSKASEMEHTGERGDARVLPMAIVQKHPVSNKATRYAVQHSSDDAEF